MMKAAFSILLFVFCSLVVGQSPPPACMLACVNENSASLTCNSMRLDCMCGSSGLNAIAPCLATKCASANAASATSYFQSQCKDGGFTVQHIASASASGSRGSGVSATEPGGSKTTATGTAASASGTSKSSADKIILASGSSGSFFGLVGAILFGLLAI